MSPYYRVVGSDGELKSRSASHHERGRSIGRGMMRLVVRSSVAFDGESPVICPPDQYHVDQ